MVNTLKVEDKGNGDNPDAPTNPTTKEVPPTSTRRKNIVAGGAGHPVILALPIDPLAAMGYTVSQGVTTPLTPRNLFGTFTNTQHTS